MCIQTDVTILVLVAQPRGASPIGAHQEYRGIQVQIFRSKLAKRIRLELYVATRPDDVLLALNQHDPDIVHISGHGTAESQLVLTSSGGEVQLVSEEAIVSLFRVMRGRIKTVVLNSCYSQSQVEQIAQHVGVAIGMSDAIGFEAAIRFSGSFYAALGAGGTFLNAFESGRLALRANRIPYESVPKIAASSDIDLSTLGLLHSSRSLDESPAEPNEERNNRQSS